MARLCANEQDQCPSITACPWTFSHTEECSRGTLLCIASKVEVPSVAKKKGKNFCAKFFKVFLATGAPPCTKHGEIEISLLSNFQLRTTLGAQKNENCRSRQNIGKNPQKSKISLGF